MNTAGMNRAFDDRAFVLRNWFSMAILAGATVWGVLEIVRYQTGRSDSTGLLFGVGFLAASAYGVYRLMAEARDTIVRLETGGGQSVVTLWRPWGLQRLAAPLAALDGWRMFIAMKTRSQRTYLLRVDHPANPRPLQIELMPGKTDLTGLRRLAPEAIADFEANTGGRKVG